MFNDMIKEMGMLGFVSYMFVLVGAVDLGIYGLISVNLLSAIFGGLSRLIYILIGAGAGYLIYMMVTKKKLL